MLSLFKRPISTLAQVGDFHSIFSEGRGFAANQVKQAKLYQGNSPFPHIVIDGFFAPNALREVLAEIPSPLTSRDLINNDLKDIQEHKYAWRDVGRLGSKSLRLIHYLSAKPFLDYLTVLSGIEGLVPDPYLFGGGFHQILRGGKLAVHADFNLHPQIKLYRRMNMLLYLNEDWDTRWGGDLELWPADMSQCGQKIAPLFNRMVVFNTTDTSFHGHPEPLDCPPDVIRKSLALYYYTHDRLHDQMHSTLWQQRPKDIGSKE